MDDPHRRVRKISELIKLVAAALMIVRVLHDLV
jgi:hypothetical protein